jgi:DNA-binding LytR/AlgR family response regulator
MPKPTVIIIEDEFFAANHLSEMLKKHHYRVLAVFHSGEAFLKQTDWQFDTAIVDIMLSGELSGLAVADALKKRLKPFLFLTANQDQRTLKEAALLSPKAYISKPFKENDVLAALTIISHNLSPKIQIRGPHGIEFLSTDEVHYIKGDGAYVEIHTAKGSLVQRKLLKEIELELGENFVRVHRSYIVNRHYIEQQSANKLKVGGKFIPLSNKYRDQV